MSKKISIEQLKPLGTKVTSELNRDREPLEDLKKVVELADEVLNGATFTNKKAAEYFYDDFLGAVSKAALKTFRFRDKEMVDLVKLLSLKMTLLFFHMIDKDCPEYVQRMRYVLDPGMSFYREYGLKMVENFSLQVFPDEPAGWREELKKGDRIDIIKKEADLKGWTTGTITEREKDLLGVIFDGESEVSCLIPVNSREIAPYGSYTGKNEWRLKLSKGDIVDCMDPSGNWYQATVLDTDSPTDPNASPKIFIGYRTYQKNGPKEDSEGKEYQGWSSAYDEWIKSFSLRVQQKGAISKQGLILCRKGEDEFDKYAIDDADDILVNSLEGKETFCVLRKDKTSCETVVHLLNVFGEQGGFDKLLALYNDKSKPLSFELAYYCFDIIGLVWNNFHRKFAGKYIPKLQEAVINYFQNAPDLEIRKFQKERFDKTLRNLDNLLRRVYSVMERHKIMEHFELSMCTIFLKSNYLQRRIDGLKGINDIVKSVSKSRCRDLTPKFLADWIQEYSILNELLGTKKHAQILQRSAHVIGFMYEQGLLDQKTLEAIWANTKDEEFRQDIFRVLQEIGFPVGSTELEFFVQKVASMDPSELCEEALDVIYEAHRGTEKFPEQLLKYANIMADIVFGKNYPLATSERALNKYAGMVSGLPFDPFKKDILAKCVNEMLSKNENSVMALNLVKRIVNQYSTVMLVGATHTKPLVLEALLKEFDLFRIFFENFENYYKSAKESNGAQTDRRTHEENVNERIEFLTFVMSNATTSPAKLSKDHLYKLWEMLCENPVDKEDAQILFKFLKEIASDQAKYEKSMLPEDGKKFFEEKICSTKNSFEHLTIEAFGCIIQFFDLINEHEGLVSVYRPPTHKYNSYTSYSSVSGAYYGEYSFTKKNENALPEVRTKVHPEKLNGVEIFWRIVQEAGNKDVVEKARDFLSKLYTMLSVELESQASEIRGAFIETYLEKLGILISSSVPQKNQMIARMISLMVDMIDESERKGTGRLKSHSALLKGYLISLVVHNNLTSGKTVPKKLEIETYSNTTIWELKAELGKYVEASPECMKVSVGAKELKDTDNGKTIGEFMQKRSGSLTLAKKDMDDIPKSPLVTESGKLTEKAKAAFIDIFNKFSKDGKMDHEGAAQFIQNTTGEGLVPVDDSRIKILFANFDQDNDGFLDADGFAEFYRDAIVNNREDTVRQNLAVHGFRNDLKKLNEIEETVINITTLPRYILSCNPKSFELFFKILDMGDNKSGEQAWSLISRLATNKSMYDQLFSLDGSDKFSWEELIDTHSTYRLLYSLQIIESFLEESDPHKESTVDSRKKDWRRNFISKGGFEFLLSIYMNQDPAKGICFVLSEKMGKFEKECLGYLGNILNNFIQSATYSLNEKLRQEISQAQVTLKRKAEEVDSETQAEEGTTAVENMLSAKAGKGKDEGKVKEKAKELQIDLKELFKAKPSTVIFLKTTTKEKKESSKCLAYEPDMDKATAERIISGITSTEFWLRQVDILAIVVFRESIDSFDSLVAASALHLFTSCVLLNQEIFTLAKAYNKEGVTFDKVLIKGMLCEKSQAIREDITDALYFLCCILKTSKANPLEYSLKTLLLSMPRKRTAEAKDCGEYFKLLGKLIDMYYETPSEPAIIEAKGFLKELVEMLKNHRTSEKRNSAVEDKLLIGIMNSIRKILTHEPGLKEEIAVNEGLLHEVFFNCLFPSVSSASTESMPSLAKAESQEGVADAQKCKTKESRTAAYRLLAKLCGGNLPSQSYLVKECLEPLCRSIKPHNGWAYIPSSESRSKLGYAGIENLGCICYMNAMIQQFYMIPTFRYALLGVDDKRPPAIKKPGDVDDNVLHQFQRIFAFLELTERQDYNPSKFCYAFKDFDGMPTNTSVQQDAQEFLNLLFDRLENLLKDTPEKYLLQSVFGGKTCSQIICKGGCGSVRKNYEDFYNLSVGVKGNKTLFEALNKFISGDTISDFYCENCAKKVDVVKRTCLHQLPNVLIIHLQRLLYNYDTMMNEKINSRLEFPKEFSIEPYTVEGVEAREKAGANHGKSKAKSTFLHGNDAEYYEYKLAGVLVHLGMAEAGHYYSYINTNRRSKEFIANYNRNGRRCREEPV